MTELNPSETEQHALRRQVSMHEFLMTGGVQLGYKDGKMAYSGPVTPITHPACPWHNPGCEAWAEITAGRGKWTALESELSDLEDQHRIESGELDADESALELISIRMQEIREELDLRPRDALALRERSAAQVSRERAASKADSVAEKKIAEGRNHAPSYAMKRESGEVDPETVLCAMHHSSSALKQMATAKSNVDTNVTSWFVIPKAAYQCIACKVGHPAPPKPRTGGNPWDKPSTSGGGDWRASHNPSSSYRRPPEPVADARNTAVAELSSASVPDEITFEDGEEEED